MELLFGLISGFFNLLTGGIGAAVGSSSAEQSNAMQAAIADKQIASQEKINAENIAMQRETNALQVSEAEKAYQRSLVSSQVRQFMDAGMSYEEALRVVSGSSAGQYAAPSLTAPVADGSGIAAAYSNQANNYQSPIGAAADPLLQGVSQFANTTLQVGAALEQALSSPSGGTIGAMSADPVLKTLTQHMDELSPADRSLFGLMRLSKSDTCPAWLKDLIGSKEWKSCLGNFAGRKFLDQYFATSYQFSSNEFSLVGMDLANKRARVQLSRDHLALDMDNAELKYQRLQNMALEVQNSVNEQLAPYQVEAGIAMFRSQAAEAELNLSKFMNPVYRQQWLKHMLLTEETGVLALTAYKSRLSKQAEWLSNDANASFVAILELCDSAGLTSSDWGAALSSIIASGVDVPEYMKDFEQWMSKFMKDATSDDHDFWHWFKAY